MSKKGSIGVLNFSDTAIIVIFKISLNYYKLKLQTDRI